MQNETHDLDENYERINKITGLHLAEIQQIDESIRSLSTAKSEEINLINVEYNNIIEAKHEMIRQIEDEIEAEALNYRKKCHGIDLKYKEREKAYLLRKKAAEAYVNVVDSFRTDDDEAKNSEFVGAPNGLDNELDKESVVHAFNPMPGKKKAVA